MKINIRLKLIGFTLCIILMVGGSISFYSIYHGRQRIFKTFEKECMKSTAIVSEIIADNLYFLDLRSIGTRLANVRVNPEINYTYVMDLEGMLLADGTKDPTMRNQRLTDVFSKEIILADDWISMVDDEIFKIGGPVFMADGSRIGYLYLGFSLDTTSQIIHDTTRSIIYVTVICLCFGAILAFIVSKSFSKPVLSMVQASSKIGKGDLDIRLSVNRKDELGVLAESVNQMAVNLSKITVSKSYVDKIIKSMLDTLIVLNSDMTIKIANQAILNLLGYEEIELIGKPIGVVFVEELTEAENEDLINKGLNNVEKTYMAKNGRKIQMSFSGSVIRNDGGKIQGIVCVAQDITERKKIEKQLAQKSEEIEKVNKEMNDFIYTVSHDMKEPLFSMEGYTSRLSRAYGNTLDEKGKRYIERLKANIEKMSKRIYDMMEVIKVGTVEYNFTNNNSRDIVRDVINELESKIKNNKINVTIQDDLPTLICAKKNLRNLFLNLIINAIKFMGDDDQRQIKIGCDEEGGYYKFFVEDTGIGIKEEYQEQIFKIFNRLKDIEVEGTGVGLAIVKKIVEIHKGRIWVESPVISERGTRFCFTIPKS